MYFYSGRAKLFYGGVWSDADCIFILLIIFSSPRYLFVLRCFLYMPFLNYGHPHRRGEIDKYRAHVLMVFQEDDAR